MKYYDISLEIYPGMHHYPGDPKFHATTLKSLEHGDGFETHKLMMGNHAGTHVDAPAHFVKGGICVTDLPLEVLNGRARVIEIHNAEKVDVPELQQLVLVDDFRVLFKTRNSLAWAGHSRFYRDHIYLTGEAAKYLVENGIKLVGFDYLSADRYGDDSFPVHKTLLESGIVLVEGLNLAEVEEGNYEMSCLPLRLKDMDAAPARVVLKG